MFWVSVSKTPLKDGYQTRSLLDDLLWSCSGCVIVSENTLFESVFYLMETVEEREREEK